MVEQHQNQVFVSFLDVRLRLSFCEQQAKTIEIAVEASTHQDRNVKGRLAEVVRCVHVDVFATEQIFCDSAVSALSARVVSW